LSRIHQDNDRLQWYFKVDARDPQVSEVDDDGSRQLKTDTEPIYLAQSQKIVYSLIKVHFLGDFINLSHN
jgi:hypothetical protein